MRKSTLVLGSISVFAIAACTWLWLQLQQARAAPASASARAIPADCPIAAPANASMPVEVLPVSGTSPSPVGPSTTVALGRNSDELEQRLLKNPDYRRALRDQERANVEEEYRDLPEFLGLSKAQSDRLFDLLAGQSVRMIDSRWQKRADDRTWLTSYQEAQARNEAELAELLGPSDIARLAEYRATQQGRAEMNSLRSELARTPEPLRQDQVAPMTSLINAEVQRLRDELQRVTQEAGDARPPGFDPALDARRAALVIATNQRILDSARGILTGTQLAGVEDLYRRQRLQMLAQTEVNRLRLEVMPPITYESSSTEP